MGFFVFMSAKDNFVLPRAFSSIYLSIYLSIRRFKSIMKYLTIKSSIFSISTYEELNDLQANNDGITRVALVRISLDLAFWSYSRLDTPRKL